MYCPADSSAGMDLRVFVAGVIEVAYCDEAEWLSAGNTVIFQVMVYARATQV